MRDEIDTFEARLVSEGKKSGCWRTAKSAARVQMKGFTSEDEGFVFRLS